MSAVGITENVKGDIKKFEVWYNGREEVYIIQVCGQRPFCSPPDTVTQLGLALKTKTKVFQLSHHGVLEYGT